MPETQPAPGNGTSGMAKNVRAFLASCAQYASARLRLASVEGREAAAHVFKLLLIVGTAVVLGAFGWLFACLAAVFVIARAFTGPNAFVWASLIMLAAHLAGVAALLLMLKSRLGTTLFAMTVDELKKDQKWLDQQN